MKALTCQNCGAPAFEFVGNRCPYCNTIYGTQNNSEALSATYKELLNKKTTAPKVKCDAKLSEILFPQNKFPKIFNP